MEGHSGSGVECSNDQDFICMNKISHDSETPAHGQQVTTVCAFIHHDFGGVEKVFLPKRAETKKFLPGVYELPGGHIESEDLKGELKREIAEEFGMKINVGDVFWGFAYRNRVKGSLSTEIIYFAKFIDPIENIKLNSEDHSEYSWFAEDEINKAANDLKPESDLEFEAIRKGFELLKGNKLHFG